jgi:CubicO group peptidase (beta-lactamase class C family)
MKKLLLSLFTLATTLAFAQPSANVNGKTSTPSFVTDSLDIYVNREIKKWNIPGVAVAIVKDGKVIVCKGYGVRSLDKKGGVDENTLFQIASNSKAFTATSLALLDYQKRFSLDDKVTRWLPAFKLYDPLATQDVMVRDLLCHRLGFETFQGDMLHWGSSMTRNDLIVNLQKLKPLYGFRSRYGYCNMGFVTAGEVIRAVSDTTWDDFLKYHFFIPLKMERTSTQWAKISSDPNACSPYTMVDGKLVVMPFVNIDNIGPCASINSCVKDLANWLLMQTQNGQFDGKQVFPPQVLQMTRTSNMIVHDQNNPLFPGKHFQNYGLGWFMEDYNGRKVISHDGGANGFVTTTCFLPEEKLGIVVLTNTDANYFYGALRQQIIDAYLGVAYRNYSDMYCQNEKYSEQRTNDEIKKWRSQVVSKNADLTMAKFVGTYENDFYGKMEIKQEKDGLRMYLSHHPQVIGLLQLMNDGSLLCTYSDPEYGVKKFAVVMKDGKVSDVMVSVNDFIDFMEYDFVKK